MHIGGGVFIRDEKIIGIFDIDGTETGEATAKTLTDLEKSGRLNAKACGKDMENLPKSFVFTVEGKAYLSPIASVTLAHRVY